MKHNALTIAVILIIVLIITYLFGTGLLKRGDVVLTDFYVSEDGTMLTFSTSIMTAMGYTRGFKDNGGGVKSHYLDFYSTFGGLNSKFGAKNNFELELDGDDCEVYFRRSDGGYELVLKKDDESGIWSRPVK